MQILNRNILATFWLVFVLNAASVEAQDQEALRAAVEANARGLKLLENGNLQAAEPILREALRNAERGFGVNHKNTGIIAQNVGACLYRQSKSKEAIPYFERSLQIAEATGSHESSAGAADYLGLCLFDIRNYQQAVMAFKKALPLQLRHRDISCDARCRLGLGRSLLKVGQYSEATEYLQKAYETLKDDPEAVQSGETAIASNELAAAFGESGSYELSEQWFRKALSIQESVWGTDSFGYNVTQLNLSRILQCRDKSDEALEFSRRAWSYFNQSTEAGPDDDQTIKAAAALGSIMVSLNRDAEADELLTEISERMASKARSNDQNIALGSLLRQLSVVRMRMGRPMEAVDFAKRSLTVLKMATGNADVELKLTEQQLNAVTAAADNRLADYETDTAGGPLVMVREDNAEVMPVNLDGKPPAKLTKGTRLWPVASDDSTFTVYVLQLEGLGKINRADVEGLQFSVVEQRMLQGASEQIRTGSRLCFEENRFEEAQRLFEKGLESRLQLLGEVHPDTAIALNGLGLCAYARGDLAIANKQFRHCLEIRTAVLGPLHRATASSQSNLAGTSFKSGDFATAESLFIQAVNALEATDGVSGPMTSAAKNNLALLYMELAEFSKAEPLFVDVLSQKSQVQGGKNPDTATTCNNLGLLYTQLGKNAEAKTYLQRSLKIYLELYGEQHERVGMVYGNLGLLHEQMGDPIAAESWYRKSHDVRKTVLGESHRDTVLSQINLGSALTQTGQSRAAVSLLESAVAISKQNLGAHKETASALLNAANAHAKEGSHRQATVLCEEAVAMFGKCLGDHHPSTVSAVRTLADLSLAYGSSEMALKFRHQERQGVRHHLVNELPGLTEDLQRAYLTNTLRSGLERALSHALLHRTDPTTAEHSAEWLLNGKSSLQEAMAAKAQMQTDDGQHKLRELNLVRRQIARLSASPRPVAEKAEEFANLTKQQRSIERQLNQFRRTPGGGALWRTLSEFRDTLSEQSVCINIARFRVRDFQAATAEESWKEAHYAAWIFDHRSDGPVNLIDLGPASEIDQAVSRFRSGVQSAVVQIREQGEEEAVRSLQELAEPLTRLLLEPLQQFIVDAEEIVLCPDGELWTLPWAALSWKGKYLTEQFRIRYTVSGRELFERAESHLASGNSAVFADPDYDADVFSAAKAGVIRNETRSSLSGDLRFPRLPGTAAEAALVLPKLKELTGQDVRLFDASMATEAAFRSLVSPEILILSTHGFFLSTPPTVAKAQALEIEHFANPLLECGLALAGANERKLLPEASDDGILTGAEIVTQNLLGTRLVVLSACETGLGEIQAGEGVSGLRQAFELAGAEAVIATLWQIDDVESALLMSRFFEELASGKTKSEALRAAQLERIEKRRERYGAAHPFFWAAFTLTGM